MPNFFTNAAGVCETASAKPPPSPLVENMHHGGSASEQYGVQQALSMSLVGDKGGNTVSTPFCVKPVSMKLWLTGWDFDHQARLHSFDLAMQVKEELVG